MQTLIDTHCHLYWETFDNIEPVIRRANDHGVVAMIVPGIDMPTSKVALDMASRSASIYAAAGVHPNDIGPVNLDGVLAIMRNLSQNENVIAIGEIGLDYYWDKTPHDVQHQWLNAQLNLAAEVGLPVILHNRAATADILTTLRTWRTRHPDIEKPGVLHSFSGSVADATAAVEMGFYIGITGPVTFKNGEEMRAVAASVPANRLLVETDAPFLAPHPHRGKTNEPAYVTHVADKIAELRGISLKEIAAITTHNAQELFGIGIA